jgi:hypothetical protein
MTMALWQPIAYLTIGPVAGILGRMNAVLNVNQSWWWLPRKEWVAR